MKKKRRKKSRTEVLLFEDFGVLTSISEHALLDFATFLRFQ